MGHSSLTLYVQLYLSGYGMELDDLKALRTWGSQTPGHPEVNHTPGVETTTGPLGQGVGNAVGHGDGRPPRARPARPGRRPRARASSTTPSGCFASDGDLEEGVSGEASSLAGTQQLGNLVLVYDDNKISIEDDTNVAFTEDVGKRYEAYGWHVQRVDDGEDLAAVDAAFAAAKAETGRPVDHRAEARSSPGRPRTSRTPAPRTARRSARTRSRPPSRSSASTRRRPSTSPPRSSSTPAQVVDPRPGGPRRLAGALRRLGAGQPRAPPRCWTA